VGRRLIIEWRKVHVVQSRRGRNQDLAATVSAATALAGEFFLQPELAATMRTTKFNRHGRAQVLPKVSR